LPQSRFTNSQEVNNRGSFRPGEPLLRFLSLHRRQRPPAGEPPGHDAGTFETIVPDWWVGDIFQTGDGRKLPIVSQSPIELAEEFTERLLYAIWTVESV
jgi:hypothetical protein